MSDNGQSHASKNEAKKSGNGLKIVIIVLLVVLLAVAGVIIYLLTRPEPEPIPDNRGTVITEDNVSDILADDEPVQDGYFETSQTIDWHFNGTTSEDAYVANKETNTRTVYFDLELADTHEVIYSSPYIPLGSEMKGVTLDKELAPGTYETIIVYHLVDDDGIEVSSVNVGLDIYVQ